MVQTSKGNKTNRSNNRNRKISRNRSPDVDNEVDVDSEGDCDNDSDCETSQTASPEFTLRQTQKQTFESTASKLERECDLETDTEDKTQNEKMRQIDNSGGSAVASGNCTSAFIRYVNLPPPSNIEAIEKNKPFAFKAKMNSNESLKMGSSESLNTAALALGQDLIGAITDFMEEQNRKSDRIVSLVQTLVLQSQNVALSSISKDMDHNLIELKGNQELLRSGNKSQLLNLKEWLAENRQLYHQNAVHQTSVSQQQLLPQHNSSNQHFPLSPLSGPKTDSQVSLIRQYSSTVIAEPTPKPSKVELPLPSSQSTLRQKRKFSQERDEIVSLHSNRVPGSPSNKSKYDENSFDKFEHPPHDGYDHDSENSEGQKKIAVNDTNSNVKDDDNDDDEDDDAFFDSLFQTSLSQHKIQDVEGYNNNNHTVSSLFTLTKNARFVNSGNQRVNRSMARVNNTVQQTLTGDIAENANLDGVAAAVAGSPILNTPHLRNKVLNRFRKRSASSGTVEKTNIIRSKNKNPRKIHLLCEGDNNGRQVGAATATSLIQYEEKKGLKSIGGGDRGHATAKTEKKNEENVVAGQRASKKRESSSGKKIYVDSVEQSNDDETSDGSIFE
ncbi:hypothetical protein HK100_008866 [Physocladia obscura]|uniref:Uncharacterized protein n=1 Tax=Physocladia obscura TaxID=109957 RepID=A0AAD5T4H1_9FUNG|nr:hypothetical protein HK100_008866 [Physocladia obscura]